MTKLLERLFSLEGRVALVTGASGGIGRALAVGLAGAGAAVAIHGRDADALAETARQVTDVGGQGGVFPADLVDPAACGELIVQVAAWGGRLDILINCAGMNRRKPVADVPLEDFEDIVAVNLRSLYFLSQAARPHLIAQGGGKIIQIGSLTSFIGLGGVGVYGATKAAVAQLTKTMAVEWAADNIQVNCLAPGFIKTPLTEASVWGDDVKRRWLLRRIPARRAGIPDDLIGTALLLASPASAYLTGQTITVDGGFLAGGWWDRDDDAAD